MSVIGTIGAPAIASAGTAGTASRGSDFTARLEASLGTGRSHHAQRANQAAENAAASQGASATASLGQMAASLFGDVLGALGAATGPGAIARIATTAYKAMN